MLEQKIEEQRAARTARVIHEYDLPREVAAESGYGAVGVVILTAQEEIDATRRSRGDAIRLGFELPKACLRVVYPMNAEAQAGTDEQPGTERELGRPKRVGHEDGSLEEAWEKIGPKGRQLIMTAYADLHTPSDGGAASFLKSRRTSVGGRG